MKKLWGAVEPNEYKGVRTFTVTLEGLEPQELLALVQALDEAAASKKEGRGYHNRTRIRRMKQIAQNVGPNLRKLRDQLIHAVSQGDQFPPCDCGLPCQIPLKSEEEKKPEQSPEVEPEQEPMKVEWAPGPTPDEEGEAPNIDKILQDILKDTPEDMQLNPKPGTQRDQGNHKWEHMPEFIRLAPEENDDDEG